MPTFTRGPSKGQLGQMANPQFSDPRQNQNLAGFPAGAKPSMVGQTMPMQRMPILPGQGLPRPQPGMPGMPGRGADLSSLLTSSFQGKPNPMFGQPGLAGTMGRPGQIGPQGQIPPGMGPQGGQTFGSRPVVDPGFGQWPAMPQGPQAGPMRAPMPGPQQQFDPRQSGVTQDVAGGNFQRNNVPGQTGPMKPGAGGLGGGK